MSQEETYTAGIFVICVILLVLWKIASAHGRLVNDRAVEKCSGCEYATWGITTLCGSCVDNRGKKIIEAQRRYEEAHQDHYKPKED